jgi:hypothetical protein
MLLGDIMADFEDETRAGEALLTLDDIVLLTRVTEAAAAQQMTPGQFAAQSVGRFVTAANDEQWLTLVGLMARADNPGRLFLQRVLAGALAQERAS